MSHKIALETPLMHAYGQFSHQQYRANSEVTRGELGFCVVIKELPLCSQLNIRGDAACQNFTSGIQQVLGIELPTEPGCWHFSAEHSLYWLGPDEWLLVSQGPSPDLEAKLRAALSGHISLVDVAGGQSILNLRGAAPALAILLKKSSVYDFGGWSDAVDGRGRCAQTTFAKASAVVANRPDGSFDLVVRRSLADYIGRWILDAGREFGCRIEG
ncbi:MAG: sarcosine oxidase, gamma subunit family protein [Porticoccaceae bacterium]|nr:sarcosine oxidase, gamma subunit family protein [Porticoccaceae bacterium]